MNTTDLIVIVVIAVIVSVAIYKIVKDKKRGVKCSGCSGGCECPDNSHK